MTKDRTKTMLKFQTDFLQCRSWMGLDLVNKASRTYNTGTNKLPLKSDKLYQTHRLI